MIERLLIALDGSIESEGILSEVERVAGPHTAIDLLHVLEPHPHEIPGLGLIVEDIARPYLRRIAQRMPERQVRILLRRGEPELEIPRAARNQEADLIALTTHARKGISRLLMGSVAETVVRNASTPVLLSRPEFVRPRKPLERILVPIDGTPGSKQVCGTVRHLVENRADVEVILLQAVPNVIVNTPLTGGMPISAVDLLPDPTESLRAYAAKLEKEGLRARAMVVFGSPADQILEQARLLDVDMIAMACAGRKGLSGALKRSVSFRVLRRADRAVLLHRIAAEAEAVPEMQELRAQGET